LKTGFNFFTATRTIVEQYNGLDNGRFLVPVICHWQFVSKTNHNSPSTKAHALSFNFILEVHQYHISRTPRDTINVVSLFGVEFNNKPVLVLQSIHVHLEWLAIFPTREQAEADALMDRMRNCSRDLPP
jgi:hypothetical protein